MFPITICIGTYIYKANIKAYSTAYFNHVAMSCEGL